MHWEHRHFNRAGIRIWPSQSGPAVVCEGTLDIFSAKMPREQQGLSLSLSLIFSISESYIGFYLCSVMALNTRAWLHKFTFVLSCFV